MDEQTQLKDSIFGPSPWSGRKLLEEAKGNHPKKRDCARRAFDSKTNSIQPPRQLKRIQRQLQRETQQIENKTPINPLSPSNAVLKDLFADAYGSDGGLALKEMPFVDAVLSRYQGQAV